MFYLFQAAKLTVAGIFSKFIRGRKKVDHFQRALLSALKQAHCVLVVCDSELVSKHGA